MELVNQDYTIDFRKFKCLRTNQIYEIVQSTCIGRYAFNVADTIVREDGERREMSRVELQQRFTNVEGIAEIDYTHFKKRKKK